MPHRLLLPPPLTVLLTHRAHCSFTLAVFRRAARARPQHSWGRSGKYADIPLVSESVYMQVEQSEHM